MKSATLLTAALAVASCLVSPAGFLQPAWADPAPDDDAGPFKQEVVASQGSVTISGKPIDYNAEAGTLIVHPKGWDDVKKPKHDNEKNDKDDKRNSKDEADDGNPTAEASMFYVAYFAKNAGANRPVTFLFNGGPGSASVLAAHGRLRPAPRGDRGRSAFTSSALPAGQQRPEPARCKRSGFCGCARYGIQQDHRQG